MKLRLEKPDEVTITTEIDDDGDARVKANGVTLFYIMADGLELNLMYLDRYDENRLPGISLEDDDRLVVRHRKMG